LGSWGQGEIIEFFFGPAIFYRFCFTGSRDKCQEYGTGNWQVADEFGTKRPAASGFSFLY